MLLCYYKPEPWTHHATLQAGVDILEANLMSTQTAQYGPKDVETFVLRTNNQREPEHYQKAKKGLGFKTSTYKTWGQGSKQAGQKRTLANGKPYLPREQWSKMTKEQQADYVKMN
eukprot:PhM_4_TR18096/c2_g1_i1/m.49136